MKTIIIVILIIVCYFYSCCNADQYNRGGGKLKKKNVFFFSDIDIDDVYTLQCLVGDSEFNLMGVCVTTTGFATGQGGADITLRVLSFMAAEDPEKYGHLLQVPVSIGSSVPVDSNDINIKVGMNDSIRNDIDSIFNTKDVYFPISSIGVSKLSCSELYLQMNSKLLEQNEKMYILSTGPATDLAILLKDHPSVMENIELVSQMGGNINEHGNIFTYKNNTVAEMNVFFDVKSFSIIVSLLNEKLLLVPLDPIYYNPINRDFFHNVLTNPKTKSGNWLSSLYINLVDVHHGEHHYFDNWLLTMDKGKAHYMYDFEAFRALKNNGCESEQVSTLFVDFLSPPPNNPNGKISIITPTNPHSKTRICMVISPFLSNYLLTEYYFYILP